MNQIVPADQTSTREIGIASRIGGSSIAPQNLGEVVRFAEVMSRADIALPKHLRGNPGACMAVALQALEWGMSPFAVASKSYAVNGAIAYEAQLIAAVVNTRSGIKGRLRYEFTGEAETLACRVTGTLDGQECTYETPPFSAILVKNSPLWKSDPRQQLGYFAARSWARRHCPEVILGVYDRDEAANFQGPDNAKDITPGVLDRLQARHSATEKPEDAREGFDASFVAAETDRAVSAPAAETEPSPVPSPLTPTGDAGSEPDHPLPPPAAPSADAAGQETGGEAKDNPVAPSVSTSDLVDRNLMKEAIDKFIRVATDPSVPDARARQDNLIATKNAWKLELKHRPDFVKACTDISNKLVKGEIETGEARETLERFLP